MRRVAPTLPVTPAMLRHFVVITLLATAGLAMFAHGENTSAMVEAQKAAQSRSSGAWGTASAEADQAKGQRQSNGMNIAADTKLERNDGSNDDYESGPSGQTADGNIRNLYPEYQRLPAGSAGQDPSASSGQAQPATVPAAIQRDASGIPIPFAKPGQGRPMPNTNPQPPARANAQDIERMMEASRARSAASKAADSDMAQEN